MADTTEIIMEFGTDGSLKMEGKGFQGRACDQAMAPFEKALGIITKRENKPEYRAGGQTHGAGKIKA